MNKPDFQHALGVSADGIIGNVSVTAFDNRMRNLKAGKLSNADIDLAARMLGVSAGHIRAIAKVEAGPQGSFDDFGRPTILFERHKFREFTGRVWDKRFPDLSASYGARKYGKYSEQWPRLLAAIRLDPEAALKSCSWGLFQVMGFHWKALGYASVLDMVLSMAKGEGAHLEAMVRYISVNRLDDELRACRKGSPQSCVAFAKGYNGSGYAKNNYHAKIAGAIA